MAGPTPVTAGARGIEAVPEAVAERLVILANGPDLETVAVRPRLIWGPGDGAWLPALVEKVNRGVFRWVDDGRYPGSTCHVYNVVEGMLLVRVRGEPGSAYFITDGPPRSFREFATAYLATVEIEPGDRGIGQVYDAGFPVQRLRLD